MNLYDILIKQVHLANRMNDYILLQEVKRAAKASLREQQALSILNLIHMIQISYDFQPTIASSSFGVLFYVLRHQVCIAIENKNIEYLYQVKQAGIGGLNDSELVEFLYGIESDIEFVIQEFENQVITLEFDDLSSQSKIEILLQIMSLETRTKYKPIYRKKLIELQEKHKNDLRSQAINSKATWLI